MRIGAHVSIAAGPDKAAEYALSVGCECVQVFAKSPRQWKGSVLDEDVAAGFAAALAAAGLEPVFTHTAYLINLATSDRELYDRSIAALADELDRGRAMGAAGVVTHIGSDPDGVSSATARRVAEAIGRARSLACQTDEGVPLLLENSAGAGTSFGGAFEHIGEVIRMTAEAGLPPTALCLDTCHAHAYGADLGGEAGWAETLGLVEAACGAGATALMHANDCMFERGAHRDRHAWIGEGHIGEAGFAAMLADPRLATVPVIVEMPGERPEKDERNVSVLKRLRDRAAGDVGGSQGR